jgi:hypothetical protein
MTEAMLRISASARVVLACACAAVGEGMTGCEGSKGKAVTDAAAPDDGAVSPEECERTALYYCERLFSCTPTIGRSTYATMAECIAQDAIDCRLQGTLIGASPKALRGWVECNVALGALDCNGFRFAAVPACDPTPGTRLDRQDCVDDVQCASSFCRSSGSTAPGFDACGHCSARTPLGGPCDDTTLCERGSVCVNEKCSLYSAEGGPCSVTAECLGDLSCVEGLCGRALALGAACTTDEACGEAACTGRVCTVRATAGPGEACSATTTCLGYTFFCDPATSRCAHLPRAGEACSSSAPCPYLQVCQDGRCAPLTEAMCMRPPDGGAAD